MLRTRFHVNLSKYANFQIWISQRERGRGRGRERESCVILHFESLHDKVLSRKYCHKALLRAAYCSSIRPKITFFCNIETPRAYVLCHAYTSLSMLVISAWHATKSKDNIYFLPFFFVFRENKARTKQTDHTKFVASREEKRLLNAATLFKTCHKFA